MEKREFIQTPESRIKTFLQDYANNFIALNIFFKTGGIEKVRDIFRNDEYKIPTIFEYIDQCNKENRTSIVNFDTKNILFTQKSNQLDKFADEINSIKNNDIINEKRFSEILEEVKKIIYEQKSN